MSLVATRDLLEAARLSHHGVGAFNVINLEYAEAVAAAATRCDAPAILQVSANAVRFHQGRVEPLVRACVAIAQAVDAPLALHLDHADNLDLCRRAVAAGCSSVMFDPGACDSNRAVAATAHAAAWARSEGVWIEGELDDIGGKPGEQTSGSPTPQTPRGLSPKRAWTRLPSPSAAGTR
jgi:fructose-bisphosphate aldolase, class II